MDVGGFVRSSSLVSALTTSPLMLREDRETQRAKTQKQRFTLQSHGRQLSLAGMQCLRRVEVGHSDVWPEPLH